MMQHILIVKIYLRTISGKNLKDVAYAINPEYEGYQRGLTSMVYKFLIIKQNQERLQMQMKW